MEEFSDIGSYIRIPCQQIKLRENEQKSHPALVEAIAEKLKANGRNYLPLIVEEVDEDEYEVLLNADVLEAAQKAKLDFVWCILADEQRRKQIEVEAKQRFEVNILTASEKTIAEMLDYIKSVNPSFRQIDPEQAAKAIVENRSETWKSFRPLTKLRCQIGEKKLKTLETYFCL
ncbi:hypothetical protein [Floridanema aerugineum]|uniref:Uncharacterized protein n=1 Tax=Floridaenema aerugineum BLCC-F46 TaxID=3153654 RepID=A0ABV4XHW5_9CYAN